MIKRITEPELMDDRAQAVAYANADFEEPHKHFIQLLSEYVGDSLPATGRAIDLGCGAADISIRFAEAYPGYRIDALDGARAMLSEGEKAVRNKGLTQRVILREIMISETSLSGMHPDLIFSNSLLHHLHQPQLLWRCIRNTDVDPLIFIMDLMRPESDAEIDELVETYASDEPAILQRDFRNSLHAAFTPEEVTAQLLEVGSDHLAVEVVSDRHLIIYLAS